MTSGSGGEADRVCGRSRRGNASRGLPGCSGWGFKACAGSENRTPEDRIQREEAREGGTPGLQEDSRLDCKGKKPSVKWRPAAQDGRECGPTQILKTL